jgi:hypothetical protein
MKKMIMISGFISALFAGDLFPSHAASSSNSRYLTNGELGAPLSKILGSVAFKTRDQAPPYISFDKNNTFDRREIVVIDDWAGDYKDDENYRGLIYVAVMGYAGHSGELLLQTGNHGDSGINYTSLKPKEIGKMLTKLEPHESKFKIAPGGPAIKDED